MNFKLKLDAPASATSEDFISALFSGYAKPETWLTDFNQLKAVIDAIALLEDFAWQMDEAGLIEEM